MPRSERQALQKEVIMLPISEHSDAAIAAGIAPSLRLVTPVSAPATGESGLTRPAGGRHDEAASGVKKPRFCDPIDEREID